MILLGIDVGSSSVKAAVLRDGGIVGRIGRCEFPTRYRGRCAEVVPQNILTAIGRAIGQIGPATRKVEAIGLSVMSPCWVMMDKTGRPLTPLITHQDRRSEQVALEMEARIGKARHLRLCGNRPFPGGISSTNWEWYRRNHPSILRRVDLIGHLNTYLHRQLTGARVVDPANASFMGFYSTLDQSGWSEALCEALKVPMRILPEVREADRIGGAVRPAAARRLGVTAGTPMMVGVVDTSSAMILVGAKVGQLLNVCGSTDVLAVCTDRPKPNERLLTRALGVGKKWMSVSSLAAAGSTFGWIHRELFAEMSEPEFYKMLARLARRAAAGKSEVRFEPYLAGDRMDIAQHSAAFGGLTLSTTRQEMLGAAIDALAEASARRLPLLRRGGERMGRDVVVSGGLQNGMEKVMYRDWPGGGWRFRVEPEASLRGVGVLDPRE